MGRGKEGGIIIGPESTAEIPSANPERGPRKCGLNREAGRSGKRWQMGGMEINQSMNCLDRAKITPEPESHRVQYAPDQKVKLGRWGYRGVI